MAVRFRRTFVQIEDTVFNGAARPRQTIFGVIHLLLQVEQPPVRVIFVVSAALRDLLCEIELVIGAAVGLAGTHSRLKAPMAVKDVPLSPIALMACLLVAAPHSPVATYLPAIPIPLVQHSVKDLSVFSMFLMW
ncbi:hypothetical protein [Bradyrhizobium sp. CCBAU 51765]|uniref:hypothetical protein n=1 Tax=Bradyrhizobium sp. CCBAU 51765 TaxID=1325102 RepID=UPI001888997C|nr:hypothetical protein [Bradyrhizobium sp. CCBAU 51765]QOZ06692.1 hypothetical protein XH96_03515 [Bradyrhizobium sp. CCBAU 51765]